MKKISEEVLKERERIKEKFIDMVEALFNRRQLLLQPKSRRVVALSDVVKLKDSFLFYIDNPDYKRMGKKKKF